jgi:hypothetical protein
MQVRITRPVVISSTVGLRHLAPGLVVELTDAEANQVLRQNAGNECGGENAKTGKGKKATQAESPA